VMSVLAVTFLSNGSIFAHVFAQSPCANGDTTYTVASGDTLAAIAGRFGTAWQQLANHNQLTDANKIYVNQNICLPGKAGNVSLTLPEHGTEVQPFVSVSMDVAVRGHSNAFPYGQCTWWASQRFFQMHGVYVPWAMNANAWQWTARANEFHWRVSGRPSVGSIIVLQPWVQGAYNLGHVAVVEHILKNGHVIASNMNWGGNRSVVNVEFAPGPGVSFIS